MCAIANRTFKQKKKDSFKEFAKSINHHTDAKYVWNKCKIFKNKWTKITPYHNTEHNQMEEKIEKALNKLSPSWVYTDPEWFPASNQNHFFDKHFDFIEFNIALNSANTKSAPGMDGIDYELIQKMPLQYKLLLLDIYNQMYELMDYPDSWKQAFVHFINKSDAKSVRPITLTSCLCKLLELLVKNRLQWWVEYYKLIPNNQSGFRKGRSCIDNLTNLTLHIDEAMMSKQDVIAAFLDVTGAFDNVNNEILLSKLAEINCSYKILRFIKFITHQRNIYTDFTTDKFRTVCKGVPQGGVLSPLLYTIYVSNITNNLPKTVIISQFADDIAVYSKRFTLNKCKNLIEKSVNILKQNLQDIGLELAPHKTVLIHFNNKGILPGQIEIEVDKCIIKSSYSTRFLGIEYDYKLTFNSQIDKIHKKCMKSMNIVKFLCGTWWGSHPETLIILYKSFVRSIVEYGGFIYFPTRKDIISKLEKIQYAAIRAALGYRISTPTNIMLAESKIPFIQECVKLLCRCYLSGVISNTNSPINKTIQNYYKKCKKKNKKKRILKQCIIEIFNPVKFIQIQKHDNIYCHEYKTIITSIPINTDMGASLRKEENPNLILKKSVDSNDVYTIYTDGSKVSGNKYVGSACRCPELNIEVIRSIDGAASVYTAECTALNDAMDMAIQNATRDIYIYSDSLSALQSLQSTKIHWKINPYILEIKKKYNVFLENNAHRTIKFFWIPSHTGIEGNETVDLLAKLATELETINIPQVPYTDLAEEFRTNSRTETARIIKQQGLAKGKTYFKKFYSNKITPWFFNRGLSREFIVTINRARSDHYNLAESLSRIGIIADSKCKCGYVNQDLNHVIWQCNLHNDQREKLIKDLQKIRIYLPSDIENIITIPSIQPCLLIFNFLKKCYVKV